MDARPIPLGKRAAVLAPAQYRHGDARGAASCRMSLSSVISETALRNRLFSSSSPSSRASTASVVLFLDPLGFPAGLGLPLKAEEG
jgi:hypothetical protein